MVNRLIKETSPYLLQHAGNPVDWYPWGGEALDRARTEDKPILLSIGYSACHWCHVMAHESFENEEIARLMNENFINIKVDREERPDLDTVYMEAVQSITGSGGWPLTVFLTSEAKPFYGGTYFPPEDRRGLPGFPRVLRTVSDAYRNRRQEVEKTTLQIATALSSRNGGFAGTEPLTTDILKQAYIALNYGFDRVNGGLGQAPKFPQPSVLEFLLRYYNRTQKEDAMEMVTLTLEKMAKGGIYDQVGGGFHRYATDSRWLVPHFEKMLYDNAQLIQVYLHAYLVTKRPLFRQIADETVNYVLREMTSPEGGYYSSQDADSEGEEGKFYLWARDEIRAVLGNKAPNILDYYGVTTSGNFDGRNILHVADKIHLDDPSIIREARALLLEERGKRILPGKDKKVLASWNGLMLSSLADAATILGRKDCLDAAIACASFLVNSMTSGGYLKHVYSQGQSKIDGFLEDYALVIDGLLNLHQATFIGKWLKEAIRLADVMVGEFWDESAGIFYDTGKRNQPLFARPRNTHDGALPSGSSAAIMALLKVSRITRNREFEQIVQKSLHSMVESMSAYPSSFGNWLSALDFYLSPPLEVAIIGPASNKSMVEMEQALFETWLPNKVVIALDPADPTAVSELGLFEHRNMVNDQPTVYVCEGYSCREPVIEPDLLRHQLRSLGAER